MILSKKIGHSSIVMKEKYIKSNLRMLRNDFPSFKERISLRFRKPSEDSHSTTILNAIWRHKMVIRTSSNLKMLSVKI